MLRGLLSFFSAPSVRPATAPVAVHAPPVAMHWLAHARRPLPDWPAIATQEHAGWSQAERDAFWTGAADQWARALAASLGPQYRVDTSARFVLLSAMAPARNADFLRFCESARRWIVRNLGPLARAEQGGKHLCLVFADPDDYYDYIAHYYPEGGEYAMSSGLFVDAGYGHFALCEHDTDAMQPVIAHELTHALLSHWPIPAWLNEGMAVNTEHSLFPRLSDPRLALYSPQEMRAKHAAFWNPERIQAFWSGAAFLGADEGSLLSYDLARAMVALAACEHEDFVAFLQRAQAGDSTAAAAEDCLGYPVEHLVQAILGEGDWAPRPGQWGRIERGGLPGPAEEALAARPAAGGA